MCATAAVELRAGGMGRFSDDAGCGSVCSDDAFADTTGDSLLLRENPAQQAILRGEQSKFVGGRGHKCVRFKTVRSSFLLRTRCFSRLSNELASLMMAGDGRADVQAMDESC